MTYKSPLSSTANYGLVKVGSGINVTNGVISSNASPTPNFGFFSDGLQTNPVANQVNLATFSNSGPSDGVSVVNNTQVTVVNAGTYTMVFTSIVGKTSGGTSTISMWLRLNGVDVGGSRQDLALTNTLALTFSTGNYTLDIPAGGNVELCWSSADTTVALTALPAEITPVRPSGASVKLTLTRIS
jgi:hypothetical protein